MFSTPGLEKYISGVILFDETIRQKMDDGTPIPRYLTDKGMLPGIKVDTGANHWPDTQERPSQRDWMDSGKGVRNTTTWVQGSQNGEQSSPYPKTVPAQHQYQQTPMLLRDMPQYVKNRVLCP